MSGGHAVLGALRCYHCRREETKVEPPVSGLITENVMCQMIKDVSTGDEGTSANFEQPVRLQLESMMAMCQAPHSQGQPLRCAECSGILLNRYCRVG